MRTLRSSHNTHIKILYTAKELLKIALQLQFGCTLMNARKICKIRTGQ